MEPKEAALLSSILHLPAGIMITSIHPSTTELVVRIECHLPSMPCPECHQSSTRIHGNYQRTVADLPCAGRNVLLMLTVLKFVCTTLTCSHWIFTEWLPGLVESYGPHDLTAHRACPIPWISGRWADGRAAGRADRRHHNPIHFVTPSHAVALSRDTSGSDTWCG